MVEYPDLQGKNILEIEPKYYNNLNIDGFSKMMKSPSYCYKFYWLEAIIQLISEGKTESTFDEIIDEMITNAWYSVREFHIHLSGMPLDGQIKDGLERAVLLLTELSELSANASKVEIKNAIKQYNSSVSEDDQIDYTDYVALLMSSVTTIINAISYVLIAFVAISLVVSSIMIGIITYISVLERTKEIGILRAIGASKRDISRVFNAETLIEGFCSGAIGIGITLLLIIPINLVVHHLTGIESLNAILPVAGGAALVVISMALTFIAGLIPSGIAARKDPVEALRTE